MPQKHGGDFLPRMSVKHQKWCCNVCSEGNTSPQQSDYRAEDYCLFSALQRNHGQMIQRQMFHDKTKLDLEKLILYLNRRRNDENNSLLNRSWID